MSEPTLFSQIMRAFEPFEERLRVQGYAVVAGVDEVGRGCLAGPVVAAAVVLPEGAILPGVADSKTLSPEERETLYLDVCRCARAISVGSASAEEIDAINILEATRLAMCRAINQLEPRAGFVLIDGNVRLPLTLPQRTLIKGDDRCLSIAAASIVAKVTRDRWMAELGHLFPVYGFAQHKGYGTPLHRRALEAAGPCRLHRMSFRGVAPDGRIPRKEAASALGLELAFVRSEKDQGRSE